MNIQLIKSNGLQYLYAKAGTASKKAPIVFVHGAYNNGHVWEKTFMPFFHQLGHDVYAIHLKDQEEAFQKKTLFSYTLNKYTQKLSSIIDLVESTPFVIGHSMGGLIVQKYLASNPDRVKGACLLAAVAPFGTKNTMKMMFANPTQLMRYTLLTLNPDIAKKYPPAYGLLSARSDEEMRKSFQSFIIRESIYALAGTFMPKVNIERVKQTPLLVLGAAIDELILPKDIIKTGEIYGIEAKIYPEMGHFMMLEPDWEIIANDIVEGLKIS
ncbi:MAG: alpha/beta hydrolase [Flammeovirgaceae bacterium]